MSKQAATQDYGAQSIEVLEQLEAVRKRPGMYLGGKDASGCLRAAIEIVDNCVDEHIMGHGNVIVVHYDLATRFVTVADRGRGVPVAIHPKTKESALTTVFTKLHAGGKFGGGSYAKTGGLHGVGASCTNAVSDSFEAWSFQSATAGARKAWHYQKFSQGKPLTKVIQKDPPKPWCDANQGTIVRFHLDAEIFGTHVIDPKTFLGKLKDLSLLNPGLKFIAMFGGKRFEFISEHGGGHHAGERGRARRQDVQDRAGGRLRPDAGAPLQADHRHPERRTSRHARLVLENIGGSAPLRHMRLYLGAQGFIIVKI